RVPVEVAATSQAEWDGALPPQHVFRAGDELLYVLRAWDAEGNFDETAPRRMQLVRPEDAERGNQVVRDQMEKALCTGMDVAQAIDRSLVEEAVADTGLRQQNTPVHGSRVRVQGRNLPEDRGLVINGQRYPVDLERKFVAEFLEPVGSHRYVVELV